MRPMSQLLMMLRYFYSQNHTFPGLCFTVNQMKDTSSYRISFKESEKLHNYLRENRPLIGWIRKQFIPISYDYSWTFWWPRYKTKPRLRWLDRRIKLEIKKEMKLS